MLGEPLNCQVTAHKGHKQLSLFIVLCKYENVTFPNYVLEMDCAKKTAFCRLLECDRDISFLEPFSLY